MYKIGSARSDERGRYTGGTPGDQKQESVFDEKGEISVQSFYVHKKGWMVIDCIDKSVRTEIGCRMVAAVMNKNIGYSQSDRYSIIRCGIDTNVPCNTDCSSLVRQCIREAAGMDPGDFNTANEALVLAKTGLFNVFEYRPGMKLYKGMILVTKTKGHTVIVTEGEPEEAPTTKKKYPKYEGASWSIVDALQSVGETDTGMKHRKKIAEANNIEKYEGSAAQNDKLLQLLKAGKLKKA